ncbi:MAG: serpin family protein [Anaerovoracaceae bacterium]|nr:serpin family protein [Anaerovoracaceae bacterium]
MKEKRNNKKKSKNEEKNPGEKILRRIIGARAVAACLMGCMMGCMILGLAGCGSGEIGASSGKPGNSVELTAAAEGVPGLEAESQAYCFVGEEDCLTDLSLELFQRICSGEENALVSPLSLVTDLTMLGRGAKGKTRAQMEQGLGRDVDFLTAYLQYYFGGLPQTEKAKLTSANSVWIRDDAERLAMEEQFLVDARAYFDAEVYRAAFDRGTVADMNRWCSEKTDGMVEDMIRQLPEDEVIHLLNAICFDAAWQEPYEKYQVRKDVFTSETGVQKNMDFMYSTESVYLEGDYETGFVKPYQDGYSFVALLPKEDLDAGSQTDSQAGQGMSMAEYVQTLTGERFRQLTAAAFSSASEVPVETAMPMFQMEYTADKEQLIPVLQSMGMTDLFDAGRADLSGMAVSSRGNIYVSSVAQKCFIEVDAVGTRAAAVTDITVSDECAPEFEEMKTVRLDRPFVFAIVDDRCGVPVFLGVVTEVE